MVELEDIRSYALSLPEVAEGPPVRAARRVASFKVRGKSFVGVEQGLRIMTIRFDAEAGKALIAARPDAYEAIWRDRVRFLGLRVDLSKVSSAEVRELIERAWRWTAPPQRR